jgi:Zn-dependent protease
MINLFNLIPLAPLDGGRLVGVISQRLWLIGVPLLVGVFLVQPSPLLILIAIIALPQLWASLRGKNDQAKLATINEKMRYGSLYLGLAAALSVLAFQVHEILN